MSNVRAYCTTQNSDGIICLCPLPRKMFEGKENFLFEGDELINASCRCCYHLVIYHSPEEASILRETVQSPVVATEHSVPDESPSSILATDRSDLSAIIPRLSLQCQNNRSILDEVNLYRQVAKALAKHQSSQKIIETVQQSISDIINEDKMIFLVVDAPSGSGKSQFPFVLSAANIRNIHLIMSPKVKAVSMLQTMYKFLQGTSNYMMRALEYDYHKLYPSGADTAASRSAGDPSSLTSLLDSCNPRPMAVVQVIFDLLGDPLAIKQKEDYTVINLLDYVANHKDRASLPVFCLDEVTDIAPEALRLLRNVFRAAGLLAVLMSTNSSAANMIVAPKFVSRSPSQTHWCTMITQLPLCTHKSLQVLGWTEELKGGIRSRGASWSLFVAFMETCILTCNPWLARLFIEALSKDDANRTTEMDSAVEVDFAAWLDSILAAASSELYAQKTVLREVRGFLGQIAMYLNVYHERPPVKKSLSSFQPVTSFGSVIYKHQSLFVAHHFAKPTQYEPKLYLQHDALHYSNGQEWEQKVIFEKCEVDTLMYLLLGGGNAAYPCSTQWKSKRSVANAVDAWSEATESFSYTAHTAWRLVCKHYNINPVSASNANAISLSGDTLECLVCVCFIAGSRLGGVGGQTLFSFLSHVLTHLVYDSCETFDSLLFVWDDDVLRDEFFCDRFGDLLMPFLGPADSPWPCRIMTLPGTYIGNIFRTEDREKIDFRAEVKSLHTDADLYTVAFTGECKKCEDAVDKKTIEGILRRVPATSSVHLVFVSSLQESYPTFQGEHWRSICEQYQHMYKANVLKLVFHKNRKLALQLVFSSDIVHFVPWQDCEVLVLFIEESKINVGNEHKRENKDNYMKPHHSSIWLS